VPPPYEAKCRILNGNSMNCRDRLRRRDIALRTTLVQREMGSKQELRVAISDVVERDD